MKRFSGARFKPITWIFVLVISGLILSSATAKADVIYSNTGTLNGVLTPNEGYTPSYSIVATFVYQSGDQGILVDELGQFAVNTGWHDSQLEVAANGYVYSSVWPYGTDISLGMAQAGSNTATFTYNAASGILTGQLNSGPVVSTSLGRLDPITNGYDQIWAFGVPDSTNIGSFVIGNNNPGGYTDTITSASISSTPEPSSLLLLSTGLVGCFGAIRRKFAR